MPRKFLERGKRAALLISAVVGFVPEGASATRIVSFSMTVAASYWLASLPPDTILAVICFAGAELLYLGTLWTVLTPQGARRRFLTRWGEEEGFHRFQTFLGPLFYAQAFTLSYLATTTAGAFTDSIPHLFLAGTAIALFLIGSATKLWAAHAVTTDIYYWKDMFLGKKVAALVSRGPYRWLTNPMYGVGQLPAYAVALWYGSLWGLAAAVVNQCLIFLFFYAVEKPFMKRIYATTST